MRQMISVFASCLLIGFFAAQPMLALASQDVCSQADNANIKVGNGSSLDFPAMVSMAMHASKFALECAAQNGSANQNAVALAYMAMSIHNGNVAAMAMHMEGDNRSALRLIGLLEGEESVSLQRANSLGDAKRAQLIKTVSVETEKIKGKL